MNWNCALTEERLSDFLEGSLSQQERDACEAHAVGCTNCTEMLAQVRELVSGMQTLDPVAEPRGLERRIVNATLRPRKQEREFAGWSGWLGAIWQPRFAMGIATVVATLVIVVHAAGLQFRQPADLTPAGVVRAVNRQAHLTYARGEKFVNDLRVVYEIRAMLASPQATPAGVRDQTAPAPNNARPNTGERNEQREERTEAWMASSMARSGGGWATLQLTTVERASNSLNGRPQ